MGRQTSQLLEAFDALPTEEQRAFTAEFLRRAIPFDSGPKVTKKTAGSAGAVFSLLDAEENDSAPSVKLGCGTWAWSRRSSPHL
jgi:hypothetical protein